MAFDLREGGRNLQAIYWKGLPLLADKDLINVVSAAEKCCVQISDDSLYIFLVQRPWDLHHHSQSTFRLLRCSRCSNHNLFGPARSSVLLRCTFRAQSFCTCQPVDLRCWYGTTSPDILHGRTSVRRSHQGSRCQRQVCPSTLSGRRIRYRSLQSTFVSCAQVSWLCRLSSQAGWCRFLCTTWASRAIRLQSKLCL